MTDFRTTATAIALALMLPAAALPQTSPEELEWLHGLLDQAEQKMAEGDMDAAWELIAEANNHTYKYDAEFDGMLEQFLPNFAFARYYREKRDFEQVIDFAGPVAAGLDVPAYRDRPERIEATMLFGEALSESGQLVAAEPILRRAVRESMGRADLTRVHARAVFALAENLSRLDRSDAWLYRREAFSVFDQGGPIEDFEIAYLRYIDLRERREVGADKGELAQEGFDFWDYAKDADLGEVDRTFYASFVGMLLAEGGFLEESLEMNAVRQAFLEQDGPLDNRYLVNGQRRSATLISLGRYDEAITSLQNLIRVAEEMPGADPAYLSYFYRDLGFTYRYKGYEGVAQIQFRKAYEVMRSVRPQNAPELLSLAAQIDPDAVDIDTFTYAVELGMVPAPLAGLEGAPAFEPDADGAAVLGAFLSGDYTALGRALDAYAATLEEEGAEPGVDFILNRALYHALMGDYQQAQSMLDEVTVLLSDPGNAGKVSPALPHLVTLINVSWSTSHRLEDAAAPLAALAAMEYDLTPAERSLYMTFKVSTRYILGERSVMPAMLRDWMGYRRASGPWEPRPWDAFAAMLLSEMAYFALPLDEADELYDMASEMLDAYPDYRFARSYAEFVRYLNGGIFAQSDAGMVEMGALVKTLETMVPANHVLNAATQFGYARTLQEAERYDEALALLREATETYRGNRYARSDIMGFFQANQAQMHMIMGQKRLAVTMAREAYDTYDFSSPRVDYAESVIYVYARALQDWGEPALVVELLERHIADERLMSNLVPELQIELYNLLGYNLISLGRIDEARAAYVHSEQLVPKGATNSDTVLSSVLFERGMMEWSAGNLREGYDAVARSNVLYQDWRKMTESVIGAQVATRQIDIDRVDVEALLAWDYAQELIGKGQE